MICLYLRHSQFEFFTVAHHNLCRPDLKVIWAPKSQVPVQPGPPFCFFRVHTGGPQSPKALHLLEGQGYEGFQVTDIPVCFV